MKKILIFCTLFASSLLAQADINSPDFAYPQQVIEDAEQQLPVYQKAGDGVGTLQALMQIAVAKQSIDIDSTQAVAERVLAAASKQKDKQVKSLMHLYAATLINNIYSQRRYSYNKRELPAYPRPADMSEWSGDMFNAVIDSLCNLAWSNAGDMAMSKLTRVVNADDNTCRFYPTQADFVASQIVNNFTNDTTLVNRVRREIMTAHTQYSAGWCNWQALQLLSSRDIKSLMQLYLSTPAEYRSNASVVFQYIASIYRATSTLQSDYTLQQFNDDLQSALPEVQGTWAENAVSELLARVNRPSMRVKAPSMVVANKPFDVKLTDIRNVSTLTVKVYQDKTVISTHTFDINHLQVAPVDSVVQMTLPLGNYRLCSYITEDGSDASSSAVQSVECYPIVLSDGDKRYVQVLNAESGEPVSGVTVSLIKQSKLLASAVSDKLGLAEIDNSLTGYLRLTNGGVSQDFSGLYVYSSEATKAVEQASTVSFTTDMPIYLPGDTVRWAGVMTDNAKVVAGRTAKVIVKGRVDQNVIAETTCTTDAFGRISGTFRVPEGVKGAVYDFSCDGNYSSNSSFTVSEFSTDKIKLTDLVVWPHKYNTEQFVVSGKVVDYTDFGVDSATVGVQFNDGQVYSTTTDLDGLFELSLDYNGTYEGVVQVTVVAQDGSVVATLSDVVDANYNISLAKMPGAIDTVNPVKVNVKVTDPAGADVDIPLAWQIEKTSKTEDDAIIRTGEFASPGEHSIDLSDLTADSYLLSVRAKEGTQKTYTVRSLTLYNSTRAELPVSSCIWAVNDTLSVSEGGKTSLTVGVREDNTIVYILRGSNLPYIKQTLSAGYHNIQLDLSDLPTEYNIVRVYAVKDVNSYSREYKAYVRRSNGLKFSTESFRDKIYANATEHWHLNITDANGKSVQSAMVLTVYDKRLADLATRSQLYITPQTYDFEGFSLSSIRYYLNNSYVYKSQTALQFESLAKPSWLYENTYSKVMLTSRGPLRAAKSMSYALAEANTGTVETADLSANLGEVEEADEAGTEMEDADSSESVELRSTVDYLALWRPDLLSDAKGKYDIDFVVPNANTTWRIEGFAWTKDGKNVSFAHDFVAAKPIMVSINTPRFVRGDDNAQISVSVKNNSDAVQTVSVNTYVDADSLTVGAVDRQIYTKTLQPGESDIVTVSLDATNTSLIKAGEAYVSATVSNDAFSDGERVSVPVLPSQTLVVDATNFYLNPGDTSYTFDVPEAAGDNYSCSLTFTENPMWTIVESLPVLTKDDNILPIATSQAGAYFSAAVALGLMKQHPELELQLNSAELTAIMNSSYQKLAELQLPNGGWRWGRWCSIGDSYTTGYVLSLFAILKQAGYLQNDSKLNSMLNNAVAYYDEAVRDTDLQYTITRPFYTDVIQSLNGSSVSKATVQEILKNWKKYDITLKARAAIALQNTGNKNMAKTLISSLDQFGTQTASKGFEFMNVRNLPAYAWLLQAYASVVPESDHVDGIRQYLIVNKQATDWGNYPTTSQIVAAMIDCGTKWTEAADGATVTVDGTTLDVSLTGRMGTLTTELTGRHVSIETNGKTPAYGAFIAEYTAPMADVEAYSDGEISINKSIYVYRSGAWQAVDSLQVGDKAKVLLTVKASRPFSNLVITDDRAATFLPTQQLPGWVYGDGISAYRDTRTSATNLYITSMPKGTYQLEYEMTVNNAGRFASGIATVICTQAPELTAHSSGTVLNVLPKR